MPPIPVYAPAPAWIPPRSRYIRLYHGCSSHDATNIQTKGIDVTLCRRDADFGRGFYTTTVLYQARQWALEKNVLLLTAGYPGESSPSTFRSDTRCLLAHAGKDERQYLRHSVFFQHDLQALRYLFESRLQ